MYNRSQHLLCRAHRLPAASDRMDNFPGTFNLIARCAIHAAPSPLITATVHGLIILIRHRRLDGLIVRSTILTISSDTILKMCGPQHMD